MDTRNEIINEFLKSLKKSENIPEKVVTEISKLSESGNLGNQDDLFLAIQKVHENEIID